MDLTEAGLRVRRLREHLGWSLVELAAKAGVSRGYLSELEKGKRENVRGVTKEALARALGWPDWATMLASDALAPPPPVTIPAQAPTSEAERLAVVGTLARALERLLGDSKSQVKADAAPVFLPVYATP